MITELEIFGIAITVMTPVYSALWYLVVKNTENTATIHQLQQYTEQNTERMDQLTKCIYYMPRKNDTSS